MTPLVKLSRLLTALVLISASAPSTNAQGSIAEQKTSLLRSGEHDFDFELGSWKTHLRVLTHPQGGSPKWAEYDGTSVVHRVWGGKANIVEREVDGATGHVAALSLRLYNPESHQWSLNSANAAGGTISVPTVGEFTNGKGEFFDFESINGRMTLVRNIWNGITADHCHFEQAFSPDGGKTWETNWVADDTRTSPASSPATW